MPKKSLAKWGGGITLLLCSGAVLCLGVWYVLPLAGNQAIFAAVIKGSLDIPTSTPRPIIERTPIPTLPRRTVQPTELASTKPVLTSTLLSELSTGSEVSVNGHETNSESGQISFTRLSTEELLTQAVLPERDLRLLAIRLKNNGQEIPETISDSTSFQIGDVDSFWISDNQAQPPRQFQVNATLKYMTDHSYWWVEDGLNVNEDNLKRSADRFEDQTYPTNRTFFGSEWSPGVDNDVRVHVFMGNVPGVAGYFSASHSYTNLVDSFSNEREMFFINLRAIAPGTDNFDGVLAHEFQHMIHWHQDKNEDTWVNEGLSELATFINHYGTSNFLGAFIHAPDTQLTSWNSPGTTLPNYGGSFLFMAYFLQRFGEEMTQAVVANPNNGVTGFNDALAQNGNAEMFDDIFADFLIANYLNDPTIADGLWGYRDFSPGPIRIGEKYSDYPVENRTTVFQYGGDYVQLTGKGNLTIEFTGSTRVKIIDNQAHSGSYQWYSHRGDEMNTRLTRAFDLTGISTATLKYWTWYNIEADWDYGYVEVSTDGGKSWNILQSPHSSTANPTGNAFGPGYTGIPGDSPVWVEESLDISSYAGQKILIRFEYVTDDAVNKPGWTVDDISIPELGFYDDVEDGINGWQAEGFVRIDNVLPQRFLVQVIELGDNGVEVHPIILDETNHGTLTIKELGATVEQAILVVSGLTPITTEPASYEYRIDYER